MNIWLACAFRKIVRTNLGGREDAVWSRLDGYLRRPENIEPDMENNDRKRLAIVKVGPSEQAVEKFRINDGARLFFVRLDQALADFLTVDGEHGNAIPAAGDYCFIGVTGSDRHDFQGRCSQLFAQRFENARNVELYRLQESDADENAVEEDRDDQNRKLNASVAAYACGIPFDSYTQYLDCVEDRDVLISAEQFKILNEIVNDNQHRTTVLMGCAGSGKTLMSVTIMLCQEIVALADQPGTRLYFSLSSRLAEASGTSFSKILACKASSESNARWARDFRAIKEEALSLRRIRPEQLLEMAIRRQMPEDVIQGSLEAVHAEFHDVNRFLCNWLKKDYSELVLYRHFKSEFYARLPESEQLVDPDDLWTEIRGLIKGYQGAQQGVASEDGSHECAWRWGRSEYALLRDMFGSELPGQADLARVQRILLEKEIVSPPRDKSGFVWRRLDVGAERNVVAACDTQERKDLAARMFEIVRKDDYSKEGLTLGEYLGLTDAQSVFEKDARRRIYALYEKYSEWLARTRRFDENDLAREVLRVAANPDFRPIEADIAAIDECQDLSEMQLRALASIVSPGCRLLFAGDRHQIINPTYFDPDRLSQMPEAGGVSFHAVSDNHRSSREIVEIANVVAAKRRQCIGTLKQQYEQSESSSVGGHYPHFLNYGNDIGVLSDGIERLSDDPTSAFVVQDEQDQRKLLELVSPEIRDQVEFKTFTIKDCKGLEFKKVFCYNILGRYARHWDHILAAGGKSHEQKYRYYFNTLYVAITRSQSGLCLLENDAAAARHRDWLIVPGKFQSEGPEAFADVLGEFETKTGSAADWLAQARELLNQAEGSDDVNLLRRAKIGFDRAAGKPGVDARIKSEAEEGAHICEIETEKVDGRSLEAALNCVRYRLVDRMPDLQDISVDQRPDVQLILEVVGDGFANMDESSVRRVSDLLADSEAGRECLQRAIEMKAIDIALAAGYAARDMMGVTE